jgi:futalosine hydrolase
MLRLKTGDERTFDRDTLLIVSATEAECKPTLQKMTNCSSLSPHLYSGTLHGKPVDLLIGGIGAVATTFRITQLLMQRLYSGAVSIGIAGSYIEDIPVGQPVQITEDCLADLGIDDNGAFVGLCEAGIVASEDDFAGEFIVNPVPVRSPYPVVRGITVQTASGSRERINQLASRFRPQVETMENAAFFYACRMMQVPFASFRGISNRVEPRNRANWRIVEAIEAVNGVLEYVFQHQAG